MHNYYARAVATSHRGTHSAGHGQLSDLDRLSARPRDRGRPWIRLMNLDHLTWSSDRNFSEGRSTDPKRLFYCGSPSRWLSVRTLMVSSQDKSHHVRVPDQALTKPYVPPRIWYNKFTSNPVECTTNTRNQICFAFYTKWSDLLVMICFSIRMMVIWYIFCMHNDADLVRIWWGFDSTKMMQLWHDLASRCVVLWRWIIAITVPHPNGAQHTNLSVSAQWHCEFCSCRCCVPINYQAVVFNIPMVADKQPWPHGKAPRGMEFHETPRKCHGKWHPNTAGTLSKPVKLFVSGRNFARVNVWLNFVRIWQQFDNVKMWFKFWCIMMCGHMSCCCTFGPFLMQICWDMIKYNGYLFCLGM